MAEKTKEDKELYNLEGGPRKLVFQKGELKAVAPGLRLVPATEDEEKSAKTRRTPEAEEPDDYGLPV